MTYIRSSGATKLDELSDVVLQDNTDVPQESTLRFTSSNTLKVNFEQINKPAVNTGSFYSYGIAPTSSTLSQINLKDANNYIIKIEGTASQTTRHDLHLPHIATSISNGHNIVGKNFTITNKVVTSQTYMNLWTGLYGGSSEPYETNVLGSTNIQFKRYSTIKLKAVQNGAAYNWRILYYGYIPLDDFKYLSGDSFPVINMTSDATYVLWKNLTKTLIHLDTGNITLPTKAEADSTDFLTQSFYRIGGQITLTIPAGVTFVDEAENSTSGAGTVNLAASKRHTLVSTSDAATWIKIE